MMPGLLGAVAAARAAADGGGGGGDVLSRTSSGKLVQYIQNDATDPFSSSDWSSNPDGSVTVTGGVLEVDGQLSNWGVAYLNALAARAKAMMQAELYGDNSQDFAGLGGLIDPGAADDDWDGIHAAVEVAGFNDRYLLVDRLGGNTHLDASSPFTLSSSRAVGTPFQFSLWVDRNEGATGEAACYDWVEDLTLSGALASARGSDLRFGVVNLKGTTGVNELYFHADKIITCSGLSTGDKLQLRDSGDTLLGEATESGGTATLDVLDIWMADAVKVEVRDSGDSLLDDLTPSSGIWGGDEYTWG